MSRMRASAFVAGGALLAAWLAAAAGTRVTPSIADRILTRGGSPHTPPASTLTTEIERLKAFGRTTGALSRSGRNPFEFVTASPKTSHRPERAAPHEPAAPRIPPGLVLTLDGIAEDSTSDGAVRTAVISAAGQLFLVKAGDAVTTRYEVVRVGADAVELRDQLTGAPVRIGLR